MAITYRKLLDLLKKGETRTVDFKIECHAFMPRHKTAKWELAKDILAMANNGNVQSFILVGAHDFGARPCLDCDNSLFLRELQLSGNQKTALRTDFCIPKWKPFSLASPAGNRNA